MNAMRRVVVVYLVGLPLCAVAQEADPIVRRQLFDPSERTDPSRPRGPVRDARCGTPMPDWDAATVAKVAQARAAEFRATGLRGYVEAQTVQLDEGAGIELLLEFINEGRTPVDLGAITNALSIVLFRKTVPGGHVIPPWSSHRTGPPVYTTEFPDEAEIRAEALAAEKEVEKRRPYRVAEPASRLPKIRTLRHLGEDGDVRLKPGQRFQMVVGITEGLADPAEYWWNLAELSKELNGSSLPSPDPSDIAPLSPGEYGLSLWLGVSVSVASPDETAPTRQHAILFCDPILIRLGQVQPEESGEEQSRRD